MGLSRFRREGSNSKPSASNSSEPTGRRNILKSPSVFFGLLAALLLLTVGCYKDDDMSTW